MKSRATTLNVCNSLMCSNMEQIIILIGNMMDKLNQSAREIQKTQLAHV